MTETFEQKARQLVEAEYKMPEIKEAKPNRFNHYTNTEESDTIIVTQDLHEGVTPMFHFEGDVKYASGMYMLKGDYKAVDRLGGVKRYWVVPSKEVFVQELAAIKKYYDDANITFDLHRTYDALNEHTQKGGLTLVGVEAWALGLKQSYDK